MISHASATADPAYSYQRHCRAIEFKNLPSREGKQAGTVQTVCNLPACSFSKPSPRLQFRPAYPKARACHTSSAPNRVVEVRRSGVEWMQRCEKYHPAAERRASRQLCHVATPVCGWRGSSF